MRCWRESLRRFCADGSGSYEAIFSGAQQVIAVSDFVRETYARMGFSGDHVTALPTGIETGDAASFAANWQLSAGRFHAVYVGSVAPMKGVHVLVEAFNRMPENARLTVAGGLDKFADYAKELQALAQHPGVEFVGQIERGRVFELLASADVAVLPTLWYEASPLIISEIFASGTPIIASRIGAVAERVRDGVDGVLFAAGDAAELAVVLRRLHDDKTQLDYLRQNVPPVVTIEQYVDALSLIYEAAVTASTTASKQLPSTE